jgi:hypothetical protein
MPDLKTPLQTIDINKQAIICLISLPFGTLRPEFLYQIAVAPVTLRAVLLPSFRKTRESQLWYSHFQK